MDIRMNLFMGRLIKHRNGLLREVVGSPSLEVFEKGVDIVPRDMV